MAASNRHERWDYWKVVGKPEVGRQTDNYRIARLNEAALRQTLSRARRKHLGDSRRAYERITRVRVASFAEWSVSGYDEVVGAWASWLNRWNLDIEVDQQAFFLSTTSRPESIEIP
jgi:hypothetical protein